MKRTGNSNLALVFCCCFTLLLAACGQRGPLFLPEKTEGAEAVTEAQEQATKNDEDSDEETP